MDLIRRRYLLAEDLDTIRRAGEGALDVRDSRTGTVRRRPVLVWGQSHVVKEDLLKIRTRRTPLPHRPNHEPYRWLSVPRWYVWEGGFLLTARAQGVVPTHAHHAIQIVIALDGRVATCGQGGEWREGRGIVVRPDAEHSFDCNGALGAMLFVDPESSEGAWLCAALQQDITFVPDARLDSWYRHSVRSSNSRRTPRTSGRSCAVR